MPAPAACGWRPTTTAWASAATPAATARAASCTCRNPGPATTRSRSWRPGRPSWWNGTPCAPTPAVPDATGAAWAWSGSTASSDVKGSIERTIQRGQGASFIWDPLDRIETPDDYTVVFHLKYPAPLDLIVSAGYSAYIFDVDVADEEWFNAGNDAGTGPYTVESWTQGEQLVLTRFDDYWGGWNDPRQWDKVVFRIVPEAATRRQLMETGQGDFTYGLPPEMVEALRSNANLQVVETPSFQNLLGMLNTEKAPLDDVRVRKALAHAFPYQQVVDHVMQGTARPARGPIPYGMWGHGEDLPQPGYDLDEARRLLAEAGYPDGGFSLV